MAGLLYYYRLFVYHFEFGQKNESIHSLLSLMEKRLYKYITIPAMLVAVISGLCMAYLNPALFNENWFRIKVTAALLMIGVTFHGISPLRKFQNKKFHPYSSKQLRIMNEVPTFLMILIVVMVILRPFQ
jgi:putative membrane protein